MSNGMFNLVIAGVGGQGNILLSRLVGRAALKKGKQVIIGETLGVAQRGGSVMSHVRISDDKLYGPLIPEGAADVIMSLEPMETLRMLQSYGNPQTVTITNVQPFFPVDVLSGRDTYPDVEALKKAMTELSKQAYFLNATEISIALGAPVAANVVMLGALVGTGLLPLTRNDIETEIKSSFSGDRVELNLRALEEGVRGVRGIK